MNLLHTQEQREILDQLKTRVKEQIDLLNLETLSKMRLELEDNQELTIYMRHPEQARKILTEYAKQTVENKCSLELAEQLTLNIVCRSLHVNVKPDLEKARITRTVRTIDKYPSRFVELTLIHQDNTSRTENITKILCKQADQLYSLLQKVNTKNLEEKLAKTLMVRNRKCNY